MQELAKSLTYNFRSKSLGENTHRHPISQQPPGGNRAQLLQDQIKWVGWKNKGMTEEMM